MEDVGIYEGGLAHLNFRGLLALDGSIGFCFAVYEYLNLVKQYWLSFCCGQQPGCEQQPCSYCYAASAGMSTFLVAFEAPAFTLLLFLQNDCQKKAFRAVWKCSEEEIHKFTMLC